jgi:hypothetical protein
MVNPDNAPMKAGGAALLLAANVLARRLEICPAAAPLNMLNSDGNIYIMSMYFAPQVYGFVLVMTNVIVVSTIATDNAIVILGIALLSTFASGELYLCCDLNVISDSSISSISITTDPNATV